MAHAALCHSNTTDAEVEDIVVTPLSNQNLSSIFDCENGKFNVTWAGAVTIRDSIRIGFGTTVSIHGDYDNGLVDYDTSQPDGEASNTTSSSAFGNPEVIADSDFGPIFYVANGSLDLENLALRDGIASISSLWDGFGGGVLAFDANLTVSGCEFKNTSAEARGGGIYSERSRVVVLDTMFRECKAGYKPGAGDGDDALDSAGGAIVVSRPPSVPFVPPGAFLSWDHAGGPVASDSLITMNSHLGSVGWVVNEMNDSLRPPLRNGVIENPCMEEQAQIREHAWDAKGPVESK